MAVDLSVWMFQVGTVCLSAIPAHSICITRCDTCVKKGMDRIRVRRSRLNLTSVQATNQRATEGLFSKEGGFLKVVFERVRRPPSSGARRFLPKLRFLHRLGAQR